MANAYIPNKTKIQLWVRAGGRCEYEGCNNVLWRDDLTMKNMNKAYVAHIIADNPKGPRGHPTLSEKLKNNLSNLMLVCDAHHRLIDIEELDEHPVSRLRKMKKDHEKRIERVTGIKPEKKSEIILFGANIGNHSSSISYSRAAEAIIPKWYPAREGGINLGMVNCTLEDKKDEYWEIQKENLKKLFLTRVRSLQEEGEINHLSIFGLAPQPLLILLGALIGDITPAETYQLHREPPDWKWQRHPKDFKYECIEPEKKDGVPALVLSLSATIVPERVTNILGENACIWEITHFNPNNDFLKSRKQLQEFRKVMRSFLDKIKKYHGENALIHVFPAAPVSIAVDIGRVVMPKADLKMRIYDENKALPNKPFRYALDLDACLIFKEKQL